jgi:hypothetical protein
MAVMRRELLSQAGEIQDCVDLAQQVICGNPLLEIKPVEKLRLALEYGHSTRVATLVASSSNIAGSIGPCEKRAPLAR